MHMVPLGKERAPAPSTTSSAAEDAAPAQHSRRRAGVIRQAQPEAPGQQLAASHAAASASVAGGIATVAQRIRDRALQLEATRLELSQLQTTVRTARATLAAERAD